MVRKYTRKVRRNKRHTRRRGGRGVVNAIKGAWPFGKKEPPSTHTVRTRKWNENIVSSYSLPRAENAIGVRN